ncbi:MAG: class I SAM-dependent RNA methyltransferase [Spirochaetaceae bacterium]|jgi:putative N6-adenine-specific DNA methylase|nr:class I SAM-dependent RNA methyltransferase [Spirochaetaceae bacterium]
MTAVALCTPGAEKILVNELKKLSAGGAVFTVLDARAGRVRFQTELEGLYQALIGLRTADRVLLQCACVPAHDFDELFEGFRTTPLEEIIPRETPLVITKVRTNHSALAAETSVQAVAHKALAGRLCEQHGVRRLPEGPGGAEFRIYLENDQAELLLDLAGEPLYKRGYRLEGGTAPLRETIAAAALLSALWKRKHPLYDPFCGAGTIAIEAALYAWNIAPGLKRRFALERFLIAQPQTEDKIREFFQARIDTSRPVRITGSDRDGRMILAARRNAQRALGEEARITFSVVDADAARGFDEDGFIVTNPPYGVRLGDAESAAGNYRAMAELPGRFPGWKLVVISDNAGFESFFGSKANICREFRSGARGLYLYEYEKQNRPPDQDQKNKKTKPVERNTKPRYNWTW